MSENEDTMNFITALIERKTSKPSKVSKHLVIKYASRSPFRFAAFIAMAVAILDVYRRAAETSTVIVLRIPKVCDPLQFVGIAEDILGIEGRHFGGSHPIYTVFKVEGDRFAVDESDLASHLGKMHPIAIARVDEDLPEALSVCVTHEIEIDLFSGRVMRSLRLVYKFSPLTNDEIGYLRSQPPAIINAVFRLGSSPSQAIERCRAFKAAEPETLQADTTAIEFLILDEVPGFGKARDWAIGFLQDFERWKAGAISWRELDRGVLLYGPSGSGKTRFAQIIANTAGMNFLPRSLAVWQAQGHLGDTLKAMLADFKRARENAPTLLFVDEADSFGDRNTFAHEYANYSTQVVNAFLAAIDGSISREGVFIIAATNYPAALDPALLRSGRLEKQIRLDHPDAEERLEILSFMCPHLAGEPQLRELAARLQNWPRASLDEFVRQARQTARKDGRTQESIADLLARLPTPQKLKKEHLYRIAVHEAGHAMVACALGRHVREVKIRTTYDPVDRSGMWGFTDVEPSSMKFLRADEEFLGDIRVMLAGIAAEELLFGSRSTTSGGADGSDLHRANVAAFEYVARFGFAKSLIQVDRLTAADLHLDKELQIEVNLLLNEQLKEARRILDDCDSALRQMANELMRTTKMDAHRVKVFFRRSAGYKTHKYP